MPLMVTENVASVMKSTVVFGSLLPWLIFRIASQLVSIDLKASASNTGGSKTSTPGSSKVIGRLGPNDILIVINGIETLT